jgi:hypothetical protein
MQWDVKSGTLGMRVGADQEVVSRQYLNNFKQLLTTSYNFTTIQLFTFLRTTCAT